MNFEEYFIKDSTGKSNCVIRTFCKLYNEEYNYVFDNLNKIKKELNEKSYNEIPVFEEYMKRHNTYKINYGEDVIIRNLKLDNERYAILCYDKKDFYHMIPIIDNTIYDKNDDCLNLYTICNYKQQ